jgi:hypothetical protein
MVHGVRMSNINIADQRQTNRKLEEQNTTLHPNLRIVRTTWARGVGAGGKARTSLLVFVSSPEAINKVITEGLVEGGEVKLTDRFYTKYGLVQCFKCCSTDISPNTAGLRLGVATVLAHTRLETVTIRLSQCALAVKLEIYQNTTTRRGLSSVSLVETYGCRFPSVSLTAQCPLLFPTTAKPDIRDPVELQKTVIRRRGRPPKTAAIPQQEDELSETSSRVTRRARQSTLSFVTPRDRMDE